VEKITLDINRNRFSHVQIEQNAWVAIDEPTEWPSFSLSLNNNAHVWESYLAVEGMHCAACAINVEKALKSESGVLSADVNATSGRARVVWSADITKPSAWMSAVSKAGYRAIPATESFSLDGRRKNQRLMFWRLLVAGFCMMQVMMYAMPTYYASPGEMTTDAQNLMRWASWVLTLPVILFSCGPFFSNALNDLKQRQISMDMPVTLGILITFLVSSAATFEPAGWWGNEVYFDSLTMFVFFLLTGRWLELRMRDRTAGALDVLMRRIPSSVERLKSDGTFERVAVRNLRVDDVIRVLPGEAFPADGTIKQGTTNADEALLTGESRAVFKDVGSAIIAGSHNLTATVQLQIEKLGQSTRYSEIVTLMERVAVDKPRLAKIADRIAKPFLFAVILAAGLAAALLWHTDHSRALMAAVAVLIVTCPCALSLATPAAMLTITGALARSGVLVRKMQALEALTKIDTIVFDKTGTLTESRMQISAITCIETLHENDALKIAANLAQNSLHPVSKALVEAAKSRALVLDNGEIQDVQEVSGSGLKANSIYGALKLGSGAFCELDNTQSLDKNQTTDTTDAVSKVYLVSNKGWLATFEVAESVKSDALSAVTTLQASNIHIEVLSGDILQSVARIAGILGIKTYLGDCTPQSKLAHIKHLQKQGRQVAMVGDGLNDGPVLALANVSIAMGQAVPLAQAQSDFVVLGGQLNMVPMLINQAHRTMHIVKQNLIWAAAYNAICVPIAVMGFLPAWLAGLGMALSSLLVVLNAARLSRGVSPIGVQK
jgi:Cu2+-exporting ATPase